jgi:Elongation factor 1 gamma, conserved domain.
LHFFTVEPGQEEEKKEEKPAKGADKKKEEKPAKKEEKPAKKQEEAEEKPAATQEKNPLDLLPPSTFNLFDFKTLFVNAKDKKEAMDFFWKNFDPNGYSIWNVLYEKAEGEGKVLFLTSNLMNGFLQRL